ncbi:hypothetical protein EP7_002449 [Isosphaeraceae bacterium EP7]
MRSTLTAGKPADPAFLAPHDCRPARPFIQTWKQDFGSHQANRLDLKKSPLGLAMLLFRNIGGPKRRKFEKIRNVSQIVGRDLAKVTIIVMSDLAMWPV